MSTLTTDLYPWKEPATKPKRGAFIVIEGLDRAGKTTQVKKLCDRLYSEGHNVKTIRFPGISSNMSIPSALTEFVNRPNNSNGQNDRQLSAKQNRNG